MNSSSVGQAREQLLLQHTLEGNVAVVKRLLQKHPYIVHTHGNGRKPLHVAAVNNRLEIAKCLMDHGADVNAVDEFMNTPLDDAEGAKKMDMITLLKTYGGLSYGEIGSDSEPRIESKLYPMNSSSVGQSRHQLLLQHTLRDNVAEVKRLLDEDISLIHLTYGNRRSPLHVAAVNNRLEVAKCLIDNGADVNALDEWKNTPLDDAEGAKKVNMITLLKTYGGLSYGENGSDSEPRPVSPPLLPTKYNWEIDRHDLDYSIKLPIKEDLTMARCKRFLGSVAIKTIHPIRTDEILAIQEFRHEVKLLMKLRHPNTVKVLGAVTDKQPFMLITEYMMLGNLHGYLLQTAPLEQSVAIRFAIHIARAMAYLHSEPNVIIYGDLNTRNILLDKLTEDPEHQYIELPIKATRVRLKLCGFGLRKRSDKRFDNYTAPEVHEHRKYDKKSDVFSFAMILYRMLECEPSISQPYYEAPKYVSQVQRPIFRANAGHSPELIQLIEQCWAEDPNERPHFVEILKKLEMVQDMYYDQTTENFFAS